MSSAAALIALVAWIPAVASAQTSGTWDQYQGGSTHAGTADGPEPPYRIRWTLPAPEGDALGPAVLDGERAYAMGREAVYAIDLATGDVAWQIARDGRMLSPPALVPGSPPTLLFVDGPAAAAVDASSDPSSTATPTDSPSATPSGATSAAPSASASPSVDASDGVEAVSTLVAVGATGGDELWRTPLPAASRTGVTVNGTVAYVGDRRGEVVAIDVATGEVLWTSDVGGPIEAPLATDGAAVVAVGEDPDGREVSVAVLDAATGDRRFAPMTFLTGLSAATSPSIVDGLVVVGMPDRLVHAFDLDDGTEAWAALTVAFFSPATGLAATPEGVYASDYSGGLYAIDPASGERRWSHQLNDLVVRGAPARVGDAVLLGLTDGRLVAVDAETGRLRWEERTPGLTGALAVGADVVVAVKGGRDAGLIAYETDPEGTSVDVASPTELDAGTTLARAGVGAAITLVVVLVPGILLRRRNPAGWLAEDDGTDDEFDDLERDDDGDQA